MYRYKETRARHWRIDLGWTGLIRPLIDRSFISCHDWYLLMLLRLKSHEPVSDLKRFKKMEEGALSALIETAIPVPLFRFYEVWIGGKGMINRNRNKDIKRKRHGPPRIESHSRI